MKKDIYIYYIHGINTSNPNFSSQWEKLLSNLIMENLGDDFKKYQIIHIPIKWKSVSWIQDLQMIGLSKTFRDIIVNNIIKRLSINGIYTVNNETYYSNDKNDIRHNIVISHSFGSVWVYKALSRMISNKTEIIPHINIMLGGALGGTNLPFGGIYIKKLKEKYQIKNKPSMIYRWINMYNKDDYVSTKIFNLKGIENIEIKQGNFNPGLEEHDAMLYMGSDQFKKIIQDSCKSFLEKDKNFPKGRKTANTTSI